MTTESSGDGRSVSKDAREKQEAGLKTESNRDVNEKAGDRAGFVENLVYMPIIHLMAFSRNLLTLSLLLPRFFPAPRSAKQPLANRWTS